MDANNNLPSTWILSTLGEVCSQPQYGYTTKAASTGNLHLLRTTDITSGQINWDTVPYCSENPEDPEKYLLESGDVVISRAGSVGFSYLLENPRPAVFASYLIRFKPSIDKKFFKYFLQSPYYWKEISENKLGIAVPNVNANKLKIIPIPLPPLNEQKRIVAKIEELFTELDAGIASLHTAQAQLKTYRQSLLKHAFEGHLTAAWRELHADQLEPAATLLQRIHAQRQARYQAEVQAWEKGEKEGKRKPSPPKDLPPLTPTDLATLPQLPDGWIWVKAEEISEFITKGTTPHKNELHDGEGEIPFIKVYNLTHNGSLDFSINPTFVSKNIHEGFLGRSKVVPGDVLMNIVGPPLGKVSIVSATYPEWNINQAIARFRSQYISNKFLSNYLLFDRTIRNMMRRAKATAGQFNLTLEICREIPIPLCCQSEQSKIIDELESRLSIIDELEQSITTALQQAEALRQSILKKAFAGQLVPQDPHDEPAAQLLARIRTQQGEKNN